MAWLYYLLEANLYLLIFYGFYRLFLQHETFYNSNRYYLLLTSVTAFLLPILQLGLLKPIPIVETLALEIPVAYAPESITATPLTPIQETFHFVDYLYPLYLCIALCFTIKLSIGLFKIIKLWLNAKKLRSGHITLVELQDQAAFSFFNLLFIHPHLAKKQTVLNHEMVHIKQKHSFDILFFELVQIICWFNPIIYFIKKDIKLLHEYIADELSTSTDMQKHEYAMFLIENSFGLTPTALTNQIFNQSILKRRINMLNKKRTAGWARLKLLVVLPLAGGMLCMSTMAFTKDYGYVDLLPEKSTTTLSMFQEPVKAKSVTKPLLKVKNVPQEKLIKAKSVTDPKVVAANRKAQDHFYPLFTQDARTKVIKPVDKRYVLINNKQVIDMQTFYGVKNTQKVVHINSKEAIAKYGQVAKYGAVEITGSNIQWLKSTEMPPPPKVDIIRFAPPKLKFKTLDTIKLKNVKIKPDSLKSLSIKLKPSFKSITPLQLKLKPVTSIKTKVVTPLKINPSIKSIDTIKLAVLNEVSLRPVRTRNLQVKREVIKRVNLKTDSTRQKPRFIEVEVKKTGNNPTDEPKMKEIEILPSKKG
jgi:hypothetical protein